MAETGQPFSPAEDEILLRKWHAGVSFAEIGRIIGRSRDAVRQRCQRLHLPNRRHEQKEQSPLGFSPTDVQHASRQEDACNLHLVDLLREYGKGKTLGEGKAAYRQRCELDIPAGAEKPAIYASFGERSYCGSPAATCAW